MKWAGTKPLVWRINLVSKQSVRVARAHHPPPHQARYADPARPVTRRNQVADSHVDGRLSCDGEIERRRGLAEVITSPMRDVRDPSRVRHSHTEMATARMLMIAAGHEDCNRRHRYAAHVEDRGRPLP